MARLFDLYRRRKATATVLVFFPLVTFGSDLALFLARTGSGWWALGGQLLVLPILTWMAVILDRSHMAELCGDQNPDQPEVLCDKRKPCFGQHSNIAYGIHWNGNPPPSRTKRPTSEVVDIALRAREEQP